MCRRARRVRRKSGSRDTNARSIQICLHWQGKTSIHRRAPLHKAGFAARIQEKLPTVISMTSKAMLAGLRNDRDARNLNRCRQRCSARVTNGIEADWEEREDYDNIEGAPAVWPTGSDRRRFKATVTRSGERPSGPRAMRGARADTRPRRQPARAEQSQWQGLLDRRLKHQKAD